MPRMLSTLTAVLLPALLLPAISSAEDSPLTLTEALHLAKERNGAIRAAQYDVEAAGSRVTQAYSSFFPSITPQYQYSNIRRAGNQVPFTFDGYTGTVGGTWRLLDSGERDFSYRSSRRAAEATRYNSQQTLRTTLFTVTQQYYEALRAQELERVAQSQVARADEILKQTRLRIEVRDAAKIEELQANADLQNARVQALAARNRVTNSAASLKATIGLEPSQALPILAKEEVATIEVPADLDSVVKDAYANRPDLLSRRRSLESQRLTRRRAQREAGVSFAFDLNNDYQFSPSRLDNRNLAAVLTYPLFDGGRTRAIVRELGANIAADEALLVQAERDARAEIEAAYAEATTNQERLTAAKTALDAARQNYEAAVDSQRRGAADLLQVLTAQVSLVTAESNYIEAQYDARISEARLKLVSGRAVPGEDNP